MAFTQWTETTPATGAVAMFNLKEMLKAASWIVKSSSDGTVFNATGDEIITGASGAGGMANNSAWFRIDNPDGVEYVVQRGTTNLVWRVKVSADDTFIGGTPGPTQVPSATDEGVSLGVGTDGAPTFENFFGADASYRHKGGADSATPYHFWSGAFPTGGGVQNHAFAHLGLSAVESTDGSPFVTVIGDTELADTNLSAEVEVFNDTRAFGYVAAIAPTTATYVVMSAATYNTAVAQAFPSGIPTNPISIDDEGIPIPFLRRSAIANPGWKGVSTVMKWLGVDRTNGDTLSVTSTRDRIIFGNVSLPWQGTVPTV